jgi:endonuclease YncB( thermonuclease family)
MSQVEIFWDPLGFQLDALGDNHFISVTDGDTPNISMAIRMLSIDTPEKYYLGSPAGKNDDLKQLADWIKEGKAPVNADLGEYLVPKLSTGTAGSLQLQQGEKATETFQQLIDEKLTRDNGSKRKMFIRCANQPFDANGRLLAYVSPYYTPKEVAELSLEERATFNLLMVKSGWASTLPIYPSLPKYSDLVLLWEAAKEAFDRKRGAWGEPGMLTGYEYRMCVKLFYLTRKIVADENVSSKDRTGWISRYCVDMTTREIYFPQEYFKVKPYDRIFIWGSDVSEAVGKLNLIIRK